ncbi:MAG: hypothetical protein VX899_10390 [Myxococcota bacterium]|nr:hypothetical protein [Myxococcota bacterium]
MRRSPHLLPLAALIAGALALGLAYGACTQDDAFISFRYAENLLAGHGLVYNPGQAVEGFTNLSWTLLMAGWMALGGEPVVGSILLGLTSLALAVVGTWKLAADPQRDWAALLAPLLVALNPLVALEAVEGLETAAFMAMSAWGLHRLLLERREGKAHLGSSAVFALACLTRPEGALLFGLAHLGLWVRAPGRLSAQVRASLLGCWPVVLTLVGVTLWRLHTYGLPLPNTFYAKTGGLAVERGLRYLGWFFSQNLVLCLGVLAWPVLRWRRGRDQDGVVLAVVAGGYLAYVVAVGGDFKPTGRFIQPVLPALATLAAISLREALERHRQIALGVGALALPLIAWQGWGSFQSAQRIAADRHANLEARRLVGDWIAAQTPPDTVLAIHSAGVIPYYAGRHTIDMWGLTDPHIARAETQDFGSGLAGHERSDPAYVFAQDPDLYLPEDRVFTLRPWELEPEPGFPEDFQARYRPASFEIEGRYLNLWVRRGFGE